MSTDRQTTAEHGRKHHPGCIACSPGGLGLRFARQPDGSVLATFPCPPEYQGYEDRLHGGVIATLADAAMTHCLFARGITAFTAKLEVTYRHPARVGREATVQAWLVSDSEVLYELKAEVRQGTRRCAQARGLFAPARESK